MKLKDMTKEQALKVFESNKDIRDDVYSSCYEGIMWYMDWFLNHDEDGQYVADYEVITTDWNHLQAHLIIDDAIAEEFGEEKIKSLEARISKDWQDMVSDKALKECFLEWIEEHSYDWDDTEYEVKEEEA